jgi:hypothetical protein
MQQALDLFELFQARKSKEAEKAVTVEAEPVARTPVRAEPLSYLTLGPVEGIVASTDPDALQEQTSSWEGKVEKFVRLSHSYSSDNTISGEKCYMVDEALYKDILLAVAARKQNESTLSSASEKLEQHLGQIEDSHNRVIQRENDAEELFVAGITLSQEKIRAGHTARMKAVMADIRTLKDSMASSSELDQNSHEMKRLRFQVAQYEGILPVYQSRLKDTEELNKKLDDEKAELAKNIERLKQKLDRAESLVFSMETPEVIRQRGPVMGSSAELFPRLLSSSPQDDHNKVGAPESAVQDSGEPVNLSVSPTEPGDTVMETSAAPAIKLSFKEIISSVQKQNKSAKNIEGLGGTSEQPPPPRLITLSTLGNKNEDTVGKRARSMGTMANEPAQKKPPQNSLASDRNPEHTLDAPRTRNQGREKEVEDEVKRSCQNIQWTRGPLPKNIDHWFYDLRNAGTVPPASLVAASRAMVLRWKSALGNSYFPFSSHNAGEMVLNLEHAHRSFMAVTRDLPISGWVSRACAKHQTSHRTVLIPTLVAKEGDPLNTRPCPLIYYYEQLLEDMKHIVTYMFEPIPRTILTPILEAQISSPSKKSRSAPSASSSSMVAATEQNTWRTQRKARSKKKTPTAYEHFQELAKDIHESNKNISNPYEQHDAEQYNWAFNSLLSEEKKDMIKRAKRLISLIKANDPPKNYIARRTGKLAGEARDWNEGTTVKEYDEEAVYELEQFVDDISTNNADKHIVGYYEDRVGAYKNIYFSDGPGGQGPF